MKSISVLADGSDAEIGRRVVHESKGFHGVIQSFGTVPSGAQYAGQLGAEVLWDEGQATGRNPWIYHPSRLRSEGAIPWYSAFRVPLWPTGTITRGHATIAVIGLGAWWIAWRTRGHRGSMG